MIEHPIYARVCKDYQALDKALSGIMDSFKITGDNKFPVEILLTRWKPRRTEQQNRYLWGVVYATIFQATGQEPEDWHEYFLGEFFGWEERELFGRKRLKPRERSSKQLKSRFSEYIEFITARCAENGIAIPPPNHDLPSPSNDPSG